MSEINNIDPFYVLELYKNGNPTGTSPEAEIARSMIHADKSIICPRPWATAHDVYRNEHSESAPLDAGATGVGSLDNQGVDG